MANLKLGSNAALDKNGFIQNYPVGTIVIRADSTIDNGWLLCDGSYVNIADYPELYAHLGATYGASAGVLFRLPPLVYNVTRNPEYRIPFSTIASEPAYPNNFYHDHTVAINATTFDGFNHSHNSPYWHGSANDINIGHRSVSNNDTNNHAHNSSGNTNTSSNAGGSEPARAAGPQGPYGSGPSGGTNHSHTGAGWSGTSGAAGDTHAHYVNWHSVNLTHNHNHSTNIASITSNVQQGSGPLSAIGTSFHPPSREVYFLIKT